MKYLISFLLFLFSLNIRGQSISSLDSYQESSFAAGISENYYLTLQSFFLKKKIQTVFFSSLFNEKLGEQTYNIYFKYRGFIGCLNYGAGIGNFGNYQYTLQQFYGILSAKVDFLKFFTVSDEVLPLLEEPKHFKNTIAFSVKINKKIVLFTDYGKNYLTAIYTNKISLGTILLDQNIQVKSQIQLYNDLDISKMQILLSFMYKFFD